MQEKASVDILKEIEELKKKIDTITFSDPEKHKYYSRKIEDVELEYEKYVNLEINDFKTQMLLTQIIELDGEFDVYFNIGDTRNLSFDKVESGEEKLKKYQRNKCIEALKMLKEMPKPDIERLKIAKEQWGKIKDGQLKYTPLEAEPVEDMLAEVFVEWEIKNIQNEGKFLKNNFSEFCQKRNYIEELREKLLETINQMDKYSLERLEMEEIYTLGNTEEIISNKKVWECLTGKTIEEELEKNKNEIAVPEPQTQQEPQQETSLVPLKENKFLEFFKNLFSKLFKRNNEKILPQPEYKVEEYGKKENGIQEHIDYLQTNEISDFTLLTEEECYGENKLEIFNIRGAEAELTDFSILLGAETSDKNEHERSGRIGVYLTKSRAESMGNLELVSAVERNERSITYPVPKRNAGPRIKLPLLSLDKIPTNGESGKRARDGVLEVEYGYYPQKIVSRSMQKILEWAYMSKTENTFTINSVAHDDYVTPFQPQNLQEYEFKGKNYVKVKANLLLRYGDTLSNGKEYSEGDTVWVEVEPVKWLVDEKQKIMVSEKILFSGIEFSIMQKFMDKYFAKDLVQSIKKEKPKQIAKIEKQNDIIPQIDVDLNNIEMLQPLQEDKNNSDSQIEI